MTAPVKLMDLAPLRPDNTYPPATGPGVVDSQSRTWEITLDGVITIDGVPHDAVPLPPGYTCVSATLTVAGDAYLVLVDSSGARSWWRAGPAQKHGEVTR
jgi:hypothetical protein